jgi:hypothetical protein
MVRASFGLSLWDSVVGAYLVARAEMAAAPFPDNDLPTAEAYMRRFYALVRRAHGENFDVAQVARLEVNWWVVHRQLFGKAENQPLIDALTELYAASYSVPAANVRAAAAYRAEAMLYSDRWVNTGRAADSPLLAQVEEALVYSYSALRAAVGPAPAGVAAPRMGTGEPGVSPQHS